MIKIPGDIQIDHRYETTDMTVKFALALRFEFYCLYNSPYCCTVISKIDHAEKALLKTAIKEREYTFQSIFERKEGFMFYNQITLALFLKLTYHTKNWISVA